MSLQITGTASGLQTIAQKSGAPQALGTDWQNALHITEFLPRYSRLNELGVVYRSGMQLTSI